MGIDEGRRGAGAGGARLASRRRVALAALLVAGLWSAAGIRRIPSGERLGVLEGILALGPTFRVEGGWVVAPPGLLRLTTYPLHAVEVALPAAAVGGWANVRVLPERWEALHHAARGAGLQGVVLEATRAAASALGSERGGELEARLRAELGLRGLELLELRLQRPLTGTTDSRLLILGLDGADWQILDDLFAEGKLPHLRGLVERGTRAKLLSIQPLLSPVVWTSVATGVEPTRHGILDFLVQDPAGAPQPVTSAQRRVPTLWEILSRAGIEVGVVGWWASWPADPVRGYLVADRVAYQLFGFRSDPEDARGKTWPPGLYEDVRPLLVEPESVRWEALLPYLSGGRTREEQFDPQEQKLLLEFRTLLASGQSYMRIAHALRSRYQPRLEVVYLEGTDTVGHLFMPYRPPRLPGTSTAGAASFAAVVDRYYETIDGYVGELLGGREDWTVLVLSDHGFATDATRPHTTDSRVGHGPAADWHRRFGVLILAGPHVRAGERIEEATIYDIAPTVLALFGQAVPRSWPGRVLAEALTEEFMGAHPPQEREEDPPREAQVQANLDPQAADLIEKLRSLGYVGDGAEAGDDSRTARNNRGVSLLAQGRFEEAERELRAGLSGEPEIPLLLFNLGLALRLQHKNDEAEPLFRRALGYRGTRRLAGNQLAQRLMETGDLAGAERLVREVLADEPDAADLRNTLGLVLEARGDKTGAAEEYRRSVGLDPDSALACNNLGNLANRRGETAEAESWYLRAIEADPYFMGSYNNLALVYQARGQLEDAIDLYDRALAKAPGNAVVLNNLGSLHFATGAHDRARESWEAAARAAPDYPSPLNNLAGLSITIGDYGAAQRWIDRALALAPDYGDARINLANVLRARGDVAGALQQLERATADPLAAGTAFKQLGLSDLAAGRLEGAAAALERALERTPRDREVLNALGETLRRQGQPRRTIELWRRSLAVDPGQAALAQELARLEAAVRGG